jgi:quercetin dioxygenase-like cupin family protein
MKELSHRFLLCCALALAQAACSNVTFYAAWAHDPKASVAITSEPHHHLALENPYVRVFKVEAPAHATTLVHRHDHDYIYVVLGASHITNVVEGKSPVQQRLQDGEVKFVPGNFAHKITNDADTPFRNVTVEILQPKKDDPAKAAEARGLDIGHGAMSMEETLFVKDGVKASEVTLNPGGMLHLESGGPRLIITVTALHYAGPACGALGTPMDAGFDWIAAGAEHMLTNTCKTPTRFVVLEFE